MMVRTERSSPVAATEGPDACLDSEDKDLACCTQEHDQPRKHVIRRGGHWTNNGQHTEHTCIKRDQAKSEGKDDQDMCG